MTEEIRAAPPKGLRRLYAWMMTNAQGRHAWAGLAAFAFAEASFFPIPADVMLVPMVLADRKRAFLLAGWCALFSVLGGAFGYAIGALFFDTVGRWLIDSYGLGAAFEGFRAAYAKYGYWIMVQGLTPIPYKLVTIASGFAGFNFALFMALSALTRGLRYTLVSSLLYFFGAPVQALIEKYMEAALIGFLVGRSSPSVPSSSRRRSISWATASSAC
jgi:membrane protein YqaA with SNARE-associated domain